jgi:protein-tyrosine phosphatase
VLVSASPPDMTPIAKADLTVAYVERHRDSDYGFQHEFEVSLYHDLNIVS